MFWWMPESNQYYNLSFLRLKSFLIISWLSMINKKNRIKHFNGKMLYVSFYVGSIWLHIPTPFSPPNIFHVHSAVYWLLLHVAFCSVCTTVRACGSNVCDFVYIGHRIRWSSYRRKKKQECHFNGNISIFIYVQLTSESLRFISHLNMMHSLLCLIIDFIWNSFDDSYYTFWSTPHILGTCLFFWVLLSWETPVNKKSNQVWLRWATWVMRKKALFTMTLYYQLL